MYEPIGRRKVYELIAEQLLARISERRLKPGDVLPPERELTRLYRAGRSSMRAVCDVVRRALISIFQIPGSPERSLEQHRAIRDAIAEGDAERARAVMQAHLARVESDVLRSLAPLAGAGPVDGRARG